MVNGVLYRGGNNQPVGRVVPAGQLLVHARGACDDPVTRPRRLPKPCSPVSGVGRNDGPIQGGFPQPTNARRGGRGALGHGSSDNRTGLRFSLRALAVRRDPERREHALLCGEQPGKSFHSSRTRRIGSSPDVSDPQLDKQKHFTNSAWYFAPSCPLSLHHLDYLGV